jgi:hypothetical protein
MSEGMSFSLSLHQPLLGPTGAHWLDSSPVLSCQDSTRQYAADDPLLSCKQQPLAEWALLRKVMLTQADQGGTPGRLQGARPWRFSVPSILPAASTAVIRLTRTLRKTSGGDA